MRNLAKLDYASDILHSLKHKYRMIVMLPEIYSKIANLKKNDKIILRSLTHFDAMIDYLKQWSPLDDLTTQVLVDEKATMGTYGIQLIVKFNKESKIANLSRFGVQMFKFQDTTRKFLHTSEPLAEWTMIPNHDKPMAVIIPIV